MVIQSIGPEWEYYIYERFVAEGYEVSLDITVTGNTQLRIREKEAMCYLVNWCCGNDPDDINRLVNIALEVIERDQVEECPAYMRVRPWFNDIGFCAWMQGYRKQFVDISHGLQLQIAAFGIYKRTGDESVKRAIVSFSKSHRFLIPN